MSRAQAALFLSRFSEAVPAAEKGYLPPVIDVEIAGNGVNHADYVQGLRTWVDAVQADGHFAEMKTIIYTRALFWREIGGPADFADHPLWIADYSHDPPRVPPPWTRWTFFQHSESGQIDGISGSVDLDRFYGDLSALLDLARAA